MRRCLPFYQAGEEATSRKSNSEKMKVEGNKKAKGKEWYIGSTQPKQTEDIKKGAGTLSGKQVHRDWKGN